MSAPEFTTMDDGQITVAAGFAPLLAQHGLDSFDKIMALPTTDVVRSVPGRSTVRIALGPFTGYLKRYDRSYLSLRKRILRALRWPGADDEASREWRKILLLRRHGFLTARHVAVGQKRRGGIVTASFLLQEQIPGGVPADQYLQKQHARRKRALLAQIGVLARRLRQAQFIHKDLYLKHIFVVERDDDWDLYLIDLQRVLGPRRHRLRWYLKDAAALAYSVRAHAGGSSTDVLRVLKSYGADKAFIRRVRSRARRLAKRTPKYKRIWNA